MLQRRHQTKWHGLLAGFGVLLLLGGGAICLAGDDTLCLPMGNIDLTPPKGVEAKRSGVEFPHSLHFDYSCKTCHHTWNGEDEITGCMASGCHDQKATPKAAGNAKITKADEIRYYKHAYHQQCIGCHKEIQIKNEALARTNTTSKDKLLKTGPTSCVKCHPQS